MSAPFLHGTCRRTYWATKILMIMGSGSQTRVTATCGTRGGSTRVGHLTDLGVGYGSLPGAGHGWIRSHGVSLLSTTAVGHICAPAGAGFPDQGICDRCMRRHSSDGQEAGLAARIRSVVEMTGSAGSPWRHGKFICRAIGSVSGIYAASTSRTHTSTTPPSQTSFALAGRTFTT